MHMEARAAAISGVDSRSTRVALILPYGGFRCLQPVIWPRARMGSSAHGGQREMMQGHVPSRSIGRVVPCRSCTCFSIAWSEVAGL